MIGNVGHLTGNGFDPFGVDHCRIRNQDGIEHSQIGIEKQGAVAQHPLHVRVLGRTGHLPALDPDCVFLRDRGRNPQTMQGADNGMHELFKIIQFFICVSRDKAEIQIPAVMVNRTAA